MTLNVVVYVVIGVGLLIAYLAMRGRRLGILDLVGFLVMAVFFDWVVFASVQMWRHEHGNPGILIVVLSLALTVPLAAFFTLGVAAVALRLMHIAITGGRDASARR